MTHLGPHAARLILAGRWALRPSAADRIRVSAALGRRLGKDGIGFALDATDEPSDFTGNVLAGDGQQARAQTAQASEHSPDSEAFATS